MREARAVEHTVPRKCKNKRREPFVSDQLEIETKREITKTWNLEEVIYIYKDRATER